MCHPNLLDVAKQRPELRQLVQLSRAGYSLFQVDGGKPFTALAPSNAALQKLADGARWRACGAGQRAAGMPQGSGAAAVVRVARTRALPCLACHPACLQTCIG